MGQRFHVNRQQLAEAGDVLSQLPGLYWILGASCTGKSSVSRLIARQSGIETLDMDGLIFGSFMTQYTADRHPAASSWFRASNPLDWALSLSWEEFDALNRASNVEFLDLLARSLAGRPEDEPLVIDGGFTHPSVLSQVAAAGCMVCLAAGDDLRFQTWETSPERAPMKQQVLDLNDGPAKWRKFLNFDKKIAETMVDESEAAGIPVLHRDRGTSVEELASATMSALNLAVGQRAAEAKQRATVTDSY